MMTTWMMMRSMRWRSSRQSTMWRTTTACPFRTPTRMAHRMARREHQVQLKEQATARTSAITHSTLARTRSSSISGSLPVKSRTGRRTISGLRYRARLTRVPKVPAVTAHISSSRGRAKRIRTLRHRGSPGKVAPSSRASTSQASCHLSPEPAITSTQIQILKQMEEAIIEWETVVKESEAMDREWRAGGQAPDKKLICKAHGSSTRGNARSNSSTSTRKMYTLST